MPVCAVVGRSSERLEHALNAQRPKPHTVVEDARLRASLERALESDADWIWVLDGSAVPRPDALQALLAALDRTDGLPAPALLTGVVVAPDGRLDASRFPWYRRFQIHVALDSVQRGLLPVVASVGPALVSRRAVEATLPSSRTGITPSSVLQWTARVLRGSTGYLVPESESEALDGRGDPMLRPGTAARLILSRAVGRSDRVALALEIAERAGRLPSPGRGA
jgi:hypothetical protein